MTVINDGDGQAAGVTKNHRLKTRAVVEAFDFHENHNNGTVWSLTTFDIDPTGANDTFFYFQNTSTFDYALTDFRASCKVATGMLKINAVSGTPAFSGGTGDDITAIGRNTSKTPILNAIAKTDPDITGLSVDGVPFFMELDTIDKLFKLSTTSRVIISPGKAAALEWVAATGTVSFTVSVVQLPDVKDL